MPIKRIGIFFKKYEKYLSPLALFLGFVVDNLTLTRIDRFYDNLVLVGYLAVAGTGIFLINGGVKIFPQKKIERTKNFLPLLVQFAFGGLFSGYFIFYSRSGSVYASWFFVFILLVLLIGNEFLRTHYNKFVFQMSIFYFTLFSFLIFFIPVVLGKMGAVVFIVSGVASLVLMYGFFKGVVFFAGIDDKKRRQVYVGVGGIFLLINTLYFSNSIPPIPLSLKEIGVFHRIEKDATGDYRVLAEQKGFIGKLTRETVHITKGAPVYVYSAVFAPTKLDTNIVHRWWYYDRGLGEWVLATEVGFPITGGREEGYRGYSYKRNIFPGEWRVDVVTERGALVGRKYFTIEYTKYPPLLVGETK